jgi:hypothetical protein
MFSTSSSLIELVQKNDLPTLKKSLSEVVWDDKNIENAVNKSIELNHLGALECLISKRCGTHELMTMTTKAAEAGHLNIVGYLIEKHAFISEDDDFNALFAAIDSGHSHIVEFLVKHYGVQIHEWYTSECPEKTWASDTFLVRAALSKNHRSIDVLLQHDVSVIRALHSFKAVYNFLEKCFSEVRNHIKEISEAKQIEVEKEINDGMKKFNEDTEKAIRILMDYAVGENFIMHGKDYPGIRFLTHLNTIAGVNFIGMSVNGSPITHEMLAEEKFQGAEHAIVTLQDLAAMPDKARRDAIENRLKIFLKKQSQLSDKESKSSLNFFSSQSMIKKEIENQMAMNKP